MRAVRFMRYAFLGAVVLLSGCMKAPKYSRPDLPVPPAWHAGGADQGSAQPDAPTAAELKWREFFKNLQLQSVIELALANNRDLRMAALNTERVQALYQIQRSEQFPLVSVVNTRDLSRLPYRMSPTAQSETTEQHMNVGSVSWELDFFGRIRSLKRQALEQYFATAQARSATQIALVGAVANSYLALAANRDNLLLARQTFDAQQASYELILRTREFGIASDLDVRQAQSQVESARADIARYAGQVTVDENALNFLVGAPVPADLLPEGLGSESSLQDIAAGVPSDVLLRRPDILAAEHQLMAAYANIGAARAAFFPRISLTAGAGFLSNDILDLYKFGNRSWNFAPQVVTPIFDAGARRANLKVSETDRDTATANYEKTIQSAFREVSDSLNLRTRLMEQQQAQEALVAALDETYRLSQARYKAGIDSYLSVLVAQRSLYGAQQGLIGIRLARLGNLVTLYKVLGGGA